MGTSSHQTHQTSGASPCGGWSDWPSYTWEQPGPLLNPLSWLKFWNPEATAHKSKIPIQPSFLHKPCAFSFKIPVLPPHWGCSLSRLRLPVSTTSNKGTCIRSFSPSRLYLSCISNTHLAPYTVITVLLTIFPLWYFTPPWLFCNLAPS